MFKKKIRNIQTHLTKHHLDALVIGNFGHQIADDLLYYLFLKTVEYGILVIPKSGLPVFYTIGFEVDEYHMYHDLCTVLPLTTSIGNIMSEHTIPGSRIGFRPSAMPLAQYDHLKQLPDRRFLELPNEEDLWFVKFEEEVTEIKKACDITDELFADLIRHWSTFRTEADAANFLLQKMIARGVEPSFPPIIASGKHAALPHHKPDTSPLLPGFCVIDMGVRYNGYCSDMTRTIYIGTPTTEEKKLYAHVLSVQEKTIQYAKSETPIFALDRFCREELGQELSKQFIHALGHGLGTQVHERPSISGKTNGTLNDYMVITIEPGVYAKNSYGIRIEDVVLIQKDNPTILTRSQKQLIEVNYTPSACPA